MFSEQAWFLIVILFRLRQSHTMRSDPSAFFTKNTRAPHGDLRGSIKPLRSNSASWTCNSSIFGFGKQYAARYVGFSPSSVLISWFAALFGGSLLGSSSGNTSANSCNSFSRPCRFLSFELISASEILHQSLSPMPARLLHLL